MMKPLRIAIVSDTFAPDVNGVAMTLERITRGLLERGNGVSIVTPVATAGDEFLENIAFTRTTVDSVPFPGYPGLRLGLPSQTRLRHRWRDTPPNLIYVATESALGYSAIRAAQKLGIPIASGFHTNFQSYSKDYKLPFLEDVATEYLKRIHNVTDMTFAPCTEVADKLTAIGFQNVKILGRGVDSALFNPSRRSSELRTKWEASDDAPVALYVGRLAPEKNLDLAAKAFAQIQSQHPDARCVVVGDGPSREEMEKKNPNLIFVGVQKGEDLAAHYASADLFVFPSMSETYGNVIMEAMASGLVGISFDYAAPHEFVVDSENGFLAPFDDEAAYLEKIDTALARWNDADLREAATTTAAPITWTKVVEDFESNLREAI